MDLYKGTIHAKAILLFWFFRFYSKQASFDAWVCLQVFTVMIEALANTFRHKNWLFESFIYCKNKKFQELKHTVPLPNTNIKLLQKKLLTLIHRIKVKNKLNKSCS